MIPYSIIAIGGYLTTLAWYLYAKATKNPALYWLMFPFLAIAIIYTYFTFYEVPVELRAVWVRGTLAVALYALSIILIIISIMKFFDDRDS